MNSGASQFQVLPLTGPGLPMWSYKMIQCLWLLLLGLDVPQKIQAAHQYLLPPTLSSETGEQKAQVTQRATSTCWHLLSSVTEKPSGGMQVA